MTKRLETADQVLKLVLAVGVIITYLLRVISGPVATALFAVAVLLIAFLIAQLVIIKFIRD